MAWVRSLAARWKYPEQRVWFVVVGWAIVLTALLAAASSSYSSVLYAHTVVEFTPSRTIAFTGTTSAGVLRDDGSVNLTMRLAIANPSSRLLAFSSIAYKSWIEDLPAEAGLPNLNRTDTVVVDETGVHQLFKAFERSLDVEPVRIAAGGTGTATLSFVLTLASDVSRFRAVQNITAYTAQVRGNGTAMPWIHWVEVLVEVRDLPAAGPSDNPFLSSLTRIVIDEGPNLG